MPRSDGERAHTAVLGSWSGKKQWGRPSWGSIQSGLGQSGSHLRAKYIPAVTIFAPIRRMTTMVTIDPPVIPHRPR
jgi:hypothetical protein